VRTFKYVGPFDEVEIPALGLTVQRNHQVQVDDVDVADSLDAQDDWQHIPKPKRQPRKAAAKKTAAPSEPADTTETQES
jgi:hypothetical protein